MDWDLVAKIIGVLVGLVGSIYQISQFNPVKRTRLKHDVEILEKLEKGSESYILLKTHIDKSIKKLYPKNQSNKIIQSPGDFIFGIIFIIGFTIWSVYIYNRHQGFSWWIVLTGFFAFAGLGGIINGFEKKERNTKSNRS